MLGKALFDADAFARAAKGAANPIKLYRDTLQQVRTNLEYLFREGESVTALVVRHATVIDEILRQAWLQHLAEGASHVALIAVGGYGRGELHPYSDIDIMLLGEADELEANGEALQGFLLFLWDIGLDVGHSVRTLEDCIEQGREDITVATNIMEARLLCGPQRLFQQMQQQTDQNHIWPGERFFRAKWDEQIARHAKFNDTAYNLEPNIKEGPGGLRDIQMVGWVAKRHFGVDSLEDLVTQRFLSNEEFEALSRGQAFLWRVRYGLHLLARRREDRLLFDHQRKLAELFGYQDRDGRLAVEHFMKEYYRTVMELERLNEMLLQLFEEEILFASESDTVSPINGRFQSRRGFLEVADSGLFANTPTTMLELFVIMARNPALKGVRAGTIRLLRQHRQLIDDSLRADPQSRELFMELLRQPRGITHELRRMNRYGILAAYLPEFDNVVGQMQHDLFHVYTVDEHTLRVVRNLRRFTVPEHHHEFPLCSKLSQRLPKPELLYIAGLYHDIAKGRGGDHSELGAIEVEGFCQRHGVSDYDTGLVTWLVRNHLMMSTTAQRKDISDPEVINAFAHQVGDSNHLDYLYLLTVADIRATSPSVWNSWKDALLAELYHATRVALRRGLGNPVLQSEVIRERKQEAERILGLQRVPKAQYHALWSRVADDYFLRYSGDEVAWHSRAIIRHGEPERPLVMLRQQTGRGGTEIFIYMPIGNAQFTVTTTLLDQLGLTIVDARIISTDDNYTLDTYIVLEEDGEPIHGSYRLEEIESSLHHYLEHPNEAPTTVNRQTARQLKHFPLTARVHFYPDEGQTRTVMEVVAADRPGLLSRLARCISQCRVTMHSAKIATLGERVEDIFFLSGESGGALNSEEQACLRGAIDHSLND